jgi:Voltage-dependent anion channel
VVERCFHHHHRGTDALGRFDDQRQVFTAGALVLWCLAVVWLLPLIVTEAIRPRLAYDVRRWATIFPLGMYPSCSFTVGKVTGIAGIVTFGQVGHGSGSRARRADPLDPPTRQVHADAGSTDSCPSRQKGQPDGSG